jgi:glutamate dehydrogenase
MSVADDDNPPEFYRKYVAEVQARIKSNAELEFEKLWLLKEGEPLSVASDSLSQHIVKLKDAIQASSLFEDEQLRQVVR